MYQQKQAIAKGTKVQRNYKDTVSRMLFREPENALSLYNALNGTNYADASQITFNMLDNAIYMGMQNDISFLIMNEVNLYEHQSTYNLNMPLTGFILCGRAAAGLCERSIVVQFQIN